MSKEFDQTLLDVLACPLTKEPLIFDKERNLLISEKSKHEYEIDDGIPILLAEDL